MTLTARPRRYLLDTTLRDGEQAAGVCFSAEQKLRIAALLDERGVYQIEAGIPAVSSGEKDTIARIIANRKNAVVSVWSRLLPSDIEHAIDVRPDIIHFSVPVSSTHIYKKLRKDKDWVTNRLKDCLELVDKHNVKTSVGLEDAFRADDEFMLSVVRILLDSGITRIRLADTVGVASPSRCREIFNKIAVSLNGRCFLGVHAHNDLGMAAANTIEAVKAGCLYADVTIGGIGERAGNCGLSQLVGASSSIFDWGMSADDARDLENRALKLIWQNK